MILVLHSVIAYQICLLDSDQKQMIRQTGQSKSELKLQTFIRGKYYWIKNASLNICLTVDKNVSDQNPTFQKHNNLDLKQIWMVEEVADQTYQFVHAYSSMALEIVQDIVKLKPNKLSNSQTFFIEKSVSNLQHDNYHMYILKEFKQSKRCLLSQSGQLKCQERLFFKDECHKWIIQSLNSHPLIKETCLIESINSGLVISINQSSDSEGQPVVQNLLANLFSQRWKFTKRNEYFAIQSLKNGLFLDINKQKMKQGNSIIQWKLKDSLNQLWILEQHGKKTYLIRSAMNRDFLLGVKGKSLKDGTQLIITKHQADAFWRITGPINF